MATSRASPVLASQAENARSSNGAAENAVAPSCRDHRARAINKESIIPSRHNSAERRWVRWKARPVKPSKNAEVKLRCTGVIRGPWI